MKIRDVMTTEVQTVDVRARLTDACRIMRENDIGALPVTENRMPVGFITDRDIAIRAVAVGLDTRTTTVGAVMTRRIEACVDDCDIKDAAAVMETRKVRRLMVLDTAGGLVGIVSVGDFALRAHNAKIVEEILETVAAGERRMVGSRPHAPSNDKTNGQYLY